MILTRRVMPRRHTYRPPRIVREVCYLCRGTGSVSVVCRDNELGAALETCSVCKGRGHLITESR